MKKYLLFSSLFIALSHFCFAQAFEWEWQHPNPVGNNLNDITILPNGTYYGVGDNGVTLRSTNSGLDWEINYIDMANGNRSVYEAGFINDSIGYACGLDGLLIKTTDGGMTWEPLNSGSTADFWYIEMIDADTGYVCGTASTLLKTTNGGQTWSPVFVSGTSTTLYKVHFVNPSTGYIGTASSTVGRLLKTTDYGNTWNIVTGYTATGTTRGIFFFDADTGWVTNSLYQILKTTDGGASFVEQADFGTGTIYEVKFWDAFNGVAAGANGDVFFTSDGGIVWNTSNIGKVINLYGLAISGFLGDEIEGINDVIVAGEGGGMAYSNDFGTNWGSLSNLLTAEDLREIQFVNPNVGYAVGGSTTFSDLLKSTDAGLTWTKLSFDQGYRLYSQYWVDDNTGYVGRRGPDGIFKTTDGGLTWSTLNPGVASSTGIWYEIVFFDADTGFASGSSGVMVKTTDGGNTWTQVDPGFGTSVVYDMWLFDSQNLLVAGSSGKIAKSTDGGNSFTLLTTPFTTTLYSIHFTDANSGYVCGTSGNAYRTTDGGNNWTQLITPGTNTLYQIIFDSFGNGWICGSLGSVWYSTDAGNNWSVSSNFPSTALMYSMTIFNERLWVCGATGNILRGFSDPLIPVELTSLSATVSDNNVTLTWTTASELNNRGFEIERRQSVSNEWVRAGFVDGFGTTTEFRTYTFNDANLKTGSYNYRIKQIDFNGTASVYNLSETVEIGVLDKFDLAQNYPNPFNPLTTIKYSVPLKSSVQLKVFDVIGNEVQTLVNEEKEQGVYSVIVDASNLASGVYFYRLKAGDFIETKKMILLK